jgi:methionyl-tRNA formyltransferase
VLVGCAEGAISLERVQLEGKKPVRGGDWFIGRGVAEGDQLE